MDSKNAIIRNYANALVTAATDASAYATGLNDNIDESKAIIATLNVIIESIRSHTVLLQQAIDKYS